MDPYGCILTLASIQLAHKSDIWHRSFSLISQEAAIAIKAPPSRQLVHPPLFNGVKASSIRETVKFY